MGILVAIFLGLLISKTRIGIKIRAGENDREMIAALGVDISKLYTMVFALGAALAGLSGALVGAIQSVEVGMGEPVLILAFVVIVIGGIGSIKGAMVGSVLVGLTDTLGGVFLPKNFAVIYGYFHSYKRRVFNCINGYIYPDGGSFDLETHRSLWV